MGTSPGIVAGERRETSLADSAIKVEGIIKRFGTAVALDGVSLHVETGTFVSLLGPSGCGKTTLLRIIGGFETADHGTITIHGQRVDRLPPDKRPVNTVFQRYALFPHKRVFENVAFPLTLKHVPLPEQRQRVAEMLDLVRLPGVEEKTPGQLSGGQAQRVALARALIGRPPVLLLDEPLAALDLKLRKAMQLELRRIQEELGTSFLYVTHDQEEALTMSDKIILMNEGRIAQEGSAIDIYERPATVFASSFIGEANLLDGVVVAVAGEITRIRLAVGAEVVAASGEGMRPGQPVVISVRPERVRVGLPGVANGTDNVLTGRLHRRLFLGNIVRTFVEIGPDQVMVAQDDVDAKPLAPGEPVEVAWQLANTTLLTTTGV